MLSMLQRALLTSAGGMGPPEFVGYTANNNGNVFGENISLAKPAGVRKGDLLIAALATHANRAITWTDAPGFGSDIMGVATMRLCVKEAGDAEPSNYNWVAYPGSTGDVRLIGQLLAFRNVTLGVTGTTGTSTGATSITVPGVTMPKPGFVILPVFSRVSQGRIQTVAGMTMTERTVNDATTGAATLSVFYQLVGAGATGDRTVNLTIGNAGGDNYGILLGASKP